MTVLYVTLKKKQLFQIRSRGQMVNFGPLKFLKNLNYFGQFVSIEKVSVIVALNFMKRRLERARAYSRDFASFET